MENLEGKYFEKTIAALKQLKNEEDINLRPEFRAKLRGYLVEKALNLPQNNSFDWADFVLRFKYLMAGVPVLAVMTIVAANIYNWQVKLPTQQIIPVTNQSRSLVVDNSLSQNATLSLNQDTMADLTSQNHPPALETFSAESVMPPLEALIAARERLTNGEQSTSEVYQETASSSRESLPMNLPELKLQTVNNEPVTTSFSVSSDQEINISPTPNAPKFIFNGKDANIIDNWMEGMLQQPVEDNANSFRQENSGRVEETGRLEDSVAQEKDTQSLVESDEIQKLEQQMEQQKLNIETDLSLPAMKTTDEVTNNTQPTFNADTAKQLVMDQPILKMEATQESLDDGKGELSKDSYINALEEKTAITEGVDLKLQTDNLSLLPTYLDDGRIYFDGEDRDEVLVAVKRGLYAKNGNLSSDYYVKVKRLDNGNYKAVLFEYGQVQQILILGHRGGELVVITEIQY